MLGIATKAPRAGSSVTSRSRLSWFSACRTMVRETLKMSAIFCSTSLVPGIRRRSTIASVIDSTMRSVGPFAVAGAGPGAGNELQRCRGSTHGLGGGVGRKV